MRSPENDVIGVDETNADKCHRGFIRRDVEVLQNTCVLPL